MTKSRVRILEGDDIPRVYVDIRLTRRMGALSPAATRMWQALKGVLFLVSAIAILGLTIMPRANVPLNVRIALAAMAVWLFWDQVVSRRHWGASHILLTTKGVLFTDENVYVRWDDIESYKVAGNLLRMRPKAGHRPAGLFAPSELDIPLTEGNREHVLELFREYGVPAWRPA